MERFEDVFSLILLAGLVALTTSMMFINIKKKNKEEEAKYYTLIRCTKCGYEYTREWKEGDFVGMVEGKCPKCGALLKVEAIYKEGEEEEEKLPIPI